MVTVKFVRAVKYNGTRIEAHTPFQVREEDVDTVKRAGAIVLDAPFGAPNTPPSVPPVKPEPENPEPEKEDIEGKELENPEPETPELEENEITLEELSKMTLVQLKEVASERGVEVASNATKADVFNAIVASLKK